MAPRWCSRCGGQTGAWSRDSELGVRLDGSAGLGASAERTFKTALSTVQLLQLYGGSIKDAQSVLGCWIFML